MCSQTSNNEQSREAASSNTSSAGVTGNEDNKDPFDVAGLLAALADALSRSEGRDAALAAIRAACSGTGKHPAQQQQRVGWRDVALLQRIEALERDNSALRKELIVIAELRNGIAELRDAVSKLRGHMETLSRQLDGVFINFYNMM
ncbi:uncharacterized protein CTHT_0019070 [Thermochaetoides thermophila DSM 1495]|uniref:Uncharacterized protein n=1 Tax=Chaetomium thermophilum (strain DSM 1495 / CBS 144.50 / IMI 039719) TaxID=759272 RepID=G0S2Z4_CHATD|nr:hypothetical protein CTHT_0019070 [Thermochaetoides thermophila DSM 1495]EGS22377.1 hypothetical protein CTHT_0019070 [Thermochaetoides thermophila DSM 1495]